MSPPRFAPVARLARRFLAVAAFNTVLAATLTSVGPHGFAENLLYSQLIGLSIWGLIDGGRFALFQGGWAGARSMAALVVVAVLTGYLAGSLAGDLLLGYAPLHSLRAAPAMTARLLLVSLAAGGMGAYFFTSRELLARARLAQEEAQRQAAEARLKLLQTQLEPHMLFNTLANLRALIGVDPSAAQRMVDRMNDYLRATLGASRATTHPLAAEFARLEDYLALMAVRMGPRLRCTLDLPPELQAVPVPPLLLQPLVENAIRHGLEPQVAGGHITVRARAVADGVELEVSDDGVGFDPAAAPPATAGQGFGMAQLRERLATAYGGLGRVEVSAAPGAGTTIRLTLPKRVTGHTGTPTDRRAA